MSNPANKIEKEEFFSLFENVVEYTPKVAEELIKLRPFSSDEALLESLSNVIEELSFDEKVRIIFWITNKSCLLNFTKPRLASWAATPTWRGAWPRRTSWPRSPPGSSARPASTSWPRTRCGGSGATTPSTGTSSASPSSFAPGRTRPRPSWRGWTGGWETPGRRRSISVLGRWRRLPSSDLEISSIISRYHKGNFLVKCNFNRYLDVLNVELAI